MATAIEETVRQVAELDETVLDSQPLFEAAAAEAHDGVVTETIVILVEES